MEEATFGIAQVYNTSAICVSLQAELLMIDREYFIKTLQTQPAVYNTLVQKSATNYK